MAPKYGVLALVEAKPGKEQEVWDFRKAHLNGPIPAALGEHGPALLAKDPDIELIELIAVK